MAIKFWENNQVKMNIRDWTQCFLNIATLYNIKQDVLSKILQQKMSASMLRFGV